MKGTPKTLFEAIINGLDTADESIDVIRHNEDRAELIHTHLRDYLAQVFGAFILRDEKITSDQVLKLFHHLVRK